MSRIVVVLLFTIATTVGAISSDAPPQPAPGPSPVPPSTIILPVTPVPPPPPVPAPTATTALTGTQCYAFQVIGPGEVWAFPDNLLVITQDVVPAGETASYTDTYFDGTTTVKFKGPCIAYFVRPVSGAKGQAQLSIVAKTAPVSIKRVTFDVNGGQPPQPPPEPPVPPVPVDQFTKDVVAAYAAEPAANKARDTTALASVYRMAAKNTVPDPSVKTYGDLFNDMTIASRTLLPANAIPKVRKVIGDRLNKTMPGAATPINRTLATSELNAVADALTAAVTGK